MEVEEEVEHCVSGGRVEEEEGHQGRVGEEGEEEEVGHLGRAVEEEEEVGH